MQITFDPDKPSEVALVRRFADLLGSVTAAPALDALQEQPAPVVRPEDVFRPDGWQPPADEGPSLVVVGAGGGAPAPRYWYHPESDSFFMTEDGSHPEGLDGAHCNEVSREDYEQGVADKANPDLNGAGAQTGDDHLDSAGLPWDARIHASTRTKLKADGRWKQKRGVDAALVASVEAELRAVMAIPPGGVQTVAAAVPPPPPAAAVPPPPPPAAPVPPVPPPPAGAAPASAQAGTAPAASGTAGTASPSDDPKTFPAFMQWLGPRLTSKALTHEKVLEAVKAEGLPSTEKLMARPDLIPLVLARLKA